MVEAAELARLDTALDALNPGAVRIPAHDIVQGLAASIVEQTLAHFLREAAATEAAHAD